MLTEQKRATEAILALVETLKQQPREIIREVVVQKEAIEPLENSLENDFPRFSKRETQVETVAVPSKMQLAVEWLKNHPEDVGFTGRELKELRRPMGIEISHKTWNDAKKQLGN